MKQYKEFLINMFYILVHYQNTSCLHNSAFRGPCISFQHCGAHSLYFTYNRGQVCAQDSNSCFMLYFVLQRPGRNGRGCQLRGYALRKKTSKSPRPTAVGLQNIILYLKLFRCRFWLCRIYPAFQFTHPDNAIVVFYQHPANRHIFMPSAGMVD